MRKSKKLQGVSKEDFTKAYSTAKSYSDVCRAFNLRLQGSNFKVIKNLAIKFGLSKITYSYADNIRKIHKMAAPLSEILIENSKAQSNDLKIRLIKESILKNECAECGLGAVWNGKPIILQLDHINGRCNDNRLSNLRILCPNCHTQTETHSGKRLKKVYICPSCKAEYAGYGDTCPSCCNHPKKISWPSTDRILEELNEKSYSQLGRELGVSDNAIRSFLRRAKIAPPRMSKGAV